MSVIRASTKWCVAAAVVVTILGCGDEGTPPETATSSPAQTLYVQPSDTGAGITSVYSQNAMHYVLQPASADRKHVLVVFLGGTNSTPSDYSTIAEYAASLGYGVIDLNYANDHLIGTLCANNDDCFSQMRGEISFGAGVAYAGGMQSYDSKLIDVDAANSIVGRLVGVLDYLAHDSTTDQAYWAQFLKADAGSPYNGITSGPAYPLWSKIVIAGHSQGGGNAAAIAMNLPSATPARRVVLLSSPDDAVGGVSARWIEAPSATPMERYWGLRAQDEGTYGDFVSMNWMILGGLGVGGANSVEQSVGDGSADPQGSHRLVLQASGAALTEHDSTAVNDAFHQFPLNRSVAWAYLFTANGTD